jgi:hypothetical protein
MTADHSSSEEQDAPSRAKKSYEKPGFRYEEVFVTSALACTKVTGGQGCMGPKKIS